MASTCPRCGHDRIHELPAAERMKKVVPGLKPKRVVCGEPTGSWPCPCRSRFHSGQHVSPHPRSA